MKTIFLRMLGADDKGLALREAITALRTRPTNASAFVIDPTCFSQIPGSPFAYWASERLRGTFVQNPAFGSNGRESVVGLKTSDDSRFVRLKWEVPNAQVAARAWRYFAKGGAFSPYYRDQVLVARWKDEGAELWAYYDKHRLRTGGMVKNPSYYFRPGLTWTPRTQKGFAFTALPSACIFGNKGPAAFAADDSPPSLLALMAIGNSKPFALLLSLQMAFGSFEVGVVLNTPIPVLRGEEQDRLASLALRAWAIRRHLDTRIETSHAFTFPALLHVAGSDLGARATSWSEQVRTVQAELAAIQARIDELSFKLYGIGEVDRGSTERFDPVAAETEPTEEGDASDEETGEDVDEDGSPADLATLAAELVSWGVGVAFGRFDVRLSTGARPLPAEPDPFDPLPACSPGMLKGDDGLPLVRPPSDYPLTFPESGVLIDDPGHALDLTGALRVVFDVVFGENADRWWNDAAALLDPKGHDLRVWLAGSFFEHHLKRHSKSRRKAPILWQLGTPSGRYSVWLYTHSLTRDSFFQLQNEVVGPKLAHEERQLAILMQDAGASPSSPERKEIAAQEAVVEEMRAMLDEVKRVAPLWSHSLDDGVVLTMAPLWRLVAQHRPWQKELKGKWDELAAGKYDWAHIAMHLWPERVIPRCATDRSLAIAHGVEDEFWLEGVDGKWRARTTPVRPIDELVRERSSPAVKAALKGLLDAPTASGTHVRGGRAASPAATEGVNR